LHLWALSKLKQVARTSTVCREDEQTAKRHAYPSVLAFQNLKITSFFRNKKNEFPKEF